MGEKKEYLLLNAPSWNDRMPSFERRALCRKIDDDIRRKGQEEENNRRVATPQNPTPCGVRLLCELLAAQPSFWFEGGWLLRLEPRASMNLDQAIQHLGDGLIKDRLLQQREGVHRVVVVDAP